MFNDNVIKYLRFATNLVFLIAFNSKLTVYIYSILITENILLDTINKQLHCIYFIVYKRSYKHYNEYYFVSVIGIYNSQYYNFANKINFYEYHLSLESSDID